MDMDPTFLRTLWAFRRNHFGIQLAVDLVFSAAFFGIVGAVIVLKNLFKRFAGSNDMKRVRMLMGYCIILGALIPGIEFLQQIGVQSTADWMSQRANVTGNDADIIALEVSYRLMEGSLRWLMSLDYIFVGVGVILAAHLSLKVPHTLSKGHAILGYITGFVGLLAFILEVVSIGLPIGYLRMAFAICAGLFALILMPIWLIVLGVQMGRMGRDAPRLAEGEELVPQRESGPDSQAADTV